MRSLFAAVTMLVLGACTCNGLGAPCSAPAECGQGGICLPVGQCAVSCTSDSSCLGGEKCSTGGGCVPVSGCGADTDCGSGNFCQVGSCGAPCTPTSSSCGAGQSCRADGHCMIDIPGKDGGDSCGGELFQSTHVQANFLIVLDHSGSMMEQINNVPKWDSAVAAVRKVTADYQSQIRFGLSMFSTPTKCDPGMNYVPVADGAAMSISNALPAMADGNGTPIGGALHIASSNSGLMDPTRANFVMVVTDGKENCNGRPVDEVKAMAAAGIKTFVVGFGGDVDAQMLNNMAVAGGTARNTTPRYYQADDQTTLTTAFNSIAQGAIGCDFKLAKAPPDPNKIYVYVNGQLIPRDPSRHVGWEFSNGNERITLYGTVCDAVANNPNAKVNIVYGCPDGTIVETNDGGGGGPIDLDAGWIN